MLHGSPKKLDFFGIFQIDFPSLSQLRSINCPDKQTESQFIFQIPYGIADIGAGQIETFAKLTILALGMPVLTALLETVREFLS